MKENIKSKISYLKQFIINERKYKIKNKLFKIVYYK